MNLADLGLPRLGDVEHAEGFLQVLLTHIEAESNDDGVDFHVRIDADTLALPTSTLKGRVRRVIDPRIGAAWARGVAEVRLDGGRFSSEDGAFALRHASAGALVRADRGATGHEILLFLRDIHPEGWNIANGASGCREELADMERVLQREVEEELLFLDGDRLITLASPTAGSELAATVEAWRDALTIENVSTASIRWEDGPDSLTVTMPDGTTTVTEDIHVIISVEDFGLECARTATVEVPPTATPLDGELLRGRLLDRPIGAFAVAALKSEKPVPARAHRTGVVIAAPRSHPLCPVTRALVDRAPTSLVDGEQH